MLHLATAKLEQYFTGHNLFMFAIEKSYLLSRHDYSALKDKHFVCAVSTK